MKNFEKGQLHSRGEGREGGAVLLSPALRMTKNADLGKRKKGKMEEIVLRNGERISTPFEARILLRGSILSEYNDVQLESALHAAAKRIRGDLTEEKINDCFLFEKEIIDRECGFVEYEKDYHSFIEENLNKKDVEDFFADLRYFDKIKRIEENKEYEINDGDDEKKIEEKNNLRESDIERYDYFCEGRKEDIICFIAEELEKLRMEWLNENKENILNLTDCFEAEKQGIWMDVDCFFRRNENFGRIKYISKGEDKMENEKSGMSFEKKDASSALVKGNRGRKHGKESQRIASLIEAKTDVSGGGILMLVKTPTGRRRFIEIRKEQSETLPHGWSVRFDEEVKKDGFQTYRSAALWVASDIIRRKWMIA